MGQAPVGRDMAGKRVTVQLGGQALRTLRNPQPFQEHTLGCDAGEFGGRGGPGNFGKIDMGGQICLTGGGQRVGMVMSAQGLQRVTK